MGLVLLYRWMEIFGQERILFKVIQKNKNKNGKYLESFLLKNSHLTVVNSLNICDGNITRVRNTTERRAESIIDFFIVCDQILPLVNKMKIDSKGDLTLTGYNGKVVKSDHRMLTLEVNLTFHKEKTHDRTEVFNVRNMKCH